MSAPTSSARRSTISNRLLVVLGLACVLLLLPELLYEKHPHVRYEAWFNFYGFHGGLATAGLWLSSLALRHVLQRPEDYYDA